MRKIIKGGADKSYGIQVARLAGVPEAVLKRAQEIVEELTENDIVDKAKQIEVKQPKSKKKAKTTEPDNQMSIFDGFANMPSTEDILLELRDLDLNALTPMDAMNKLYQIQQIVKVRW